METRYRIILVDDHPLCAGAIQRRLSAVPELEVERAAADVETALALVAATAPEVVLVHLSRQADAARLLSMVRDVRPDTRTLVMLEEDIAEERVEQLAALTDGLVLTRATAEEVAAAIDIVGGGGAAVAPELAAGIVRAYAALRREAKATSLDPRQQRALDLAVEGRTDTEIAVTMGLSRRTVQRLLAAVRMQAGLRRRADLIRWAAADLPEIADDVSDVG